MPFLTASLRRGEAVFVQLPDYGASTQEIVKLADF